MKEFNLEEYLANPDRRIVTRDGRAAKILCTDRNDEYSIVALVTAKDGKEQVYCYFPNGRQYGAGNDCRDLMFAPIKKEGWVNIYASQIAGDRYSGYSIFPNESEARLAVENKQTYIATVKIEWEE